MTKIAEKFTYTMTEARFPKTLSAPFLIAFLRGNKKFNPRFGKFN